MRDHIRNSLAVRGVVFAALTMTALSAIAESHTSARSTPDEIIVSVRKQEESLQEVPISVNVIDNEQLTRLGVNTLQDITKLTPSLVFDEGFAPQDTRVVIRGLAPTRGRQNVAFLQDGIDISSEALTTAGGSLLTNPRLFDLERVEVVKGPQSALYGRSAFAGGINYVTRRPGDEVEGAIRLDVNDQNAFQTSAGISGPVIADKLNLGFNGAVWEEDGYFRNSLTGKKVGGTEGKGVSGTAVWNPADSVEFFARLEYTDDEFDPSAQATVAATQTLPVPTNAIRSATNPMGIVNSTLTNVLVPQGRVPDTKTLIVQNSQNPRTGVDYPGSERQVARFSLIGEFDLAWGQLTWFSHLANVDTKQFQDAQRNGSIFDANPPGSPVVTNSAETNLDQETDLVSQELRFSRQTDGPVDWAAGVLYWREKAELMDGSNACFTFIFPPSPDTCGDLVGQLGSTIPLNKRFWKRDTEHWSAYVDLDWQFADQWVLGFEVRYAEEDLNVIGPDSQIVFDPGFAFGGNNLGPAMSVPGQLKDDYWAPKATLQWMPADDLMFYGSIAKGVKPAGISTVVGGIAPFDPDVFRFDQEKVIVYEIGGKSTLADGALTINGALFFQDFTDKQVSTQKNLGPGVVGIVPDNAGKAEIWGFEADVFWLATDRLSFSGSYTWLDGEYTEFVTDSTGGSSLARAGNCTLGESKKDPGVTVCKIDLSGRKLEGLPEHSLVGTASYRFPISSSMDILTEFQAQYQSERFQSEFNVLEFQSYWLADFRFGLQAERWEIIGYMDNVFDDDTTRSGFVAPDFRLFGISFNPPPITVSLPNQATYSLTRPRTLGVRGALRF